MKSVSALCERSLQHFALTLKSAQCCTQSEDQGACCTCGCVETRPRKRAAAKIPTTPAAKPAWRRLPESASLSSTKQCSQEGAVLLRAVKASPAGAANQDDGKFNPAAPSDSEHEDDSMVRASLAPARPLSLWRSHKELQVLGVLSNVTAAVARFSALRSALRHRSGIT